jgi:hypothetical protein
MFQIIVVPSLRKKEVFFLDCLPWKMRRYKLGNIVSDPRRPEFSETLLWQTQSLHMGSSFCTQTTYHYSYELGCYNIMLQSMKIFHYTEMTD